MERNGRTALFAALLLAAPLLAQRTTFTALSPGCYAIGAPSVRHPGTGAPGIYWTQHDPYLDRIAGTGSNPSRFQIVLLSLRHAPSPVPLPLPSYWGCQVHVPPDIALLDPHPFVPIVGYRPGFQFHVQGIEFWTGDNGFSSPVYPAYASVTTAWRVDI